MKDLRHALRAGDEVRERETVEHLVEGRVRPAQDRGETAGVRDDAIAAAEKHSARTLGPSVMRTDLAHVDLAGGAREPQPAAPPARVRQEGLPCPSWCTTLTTWFSETRYFSAISAMFARPSGAVATYSSTRNE
jgi:hypothetical protein